MQNGEKFLPIGTVVMLKGGKKRVMVTGFCIVDNNNSNKIYDYCGCLYPEGFIDSSKNLLFDHDQINKIYYKGYIDEEELTFKQNLKKMLDKLPKNGSLGNEHIDIIKFDE